MQEQHTQSTGQGASPLKIADVTEAVDRLHQIAAHIHILWMAAAGLENEEDQEAISQVCKDGLKHCKRAFEALNFANDPAERETTDGQLAECSLRMRRLLEKKYSGFRVEQSIARRDDGAFMVYMFEIHPPAHLRS